MLHGSLDNTPAYRQAGILKQDSRPACPALGRDRLPAGRQGAGRQGLNIDDTDDSLPEESL